MTPDTGIPAHQSRPEDSVSDERDADLSATRGPAATTPISSTQSIVLSLFEYSKWIHACEVSAARWVQSLSDLYLTHSEYSGSVQSETAAGVRWPERFEKRLTELRQLSEKANQLMAQIIKVVGAVAPDAYKIQFSSLPESEQIDRSDLLDMPTGALHKILMESLTPVRMAVVEKQSSELTAEYRRFLAFQHEFLSNLEGIGVTVSYEQSIVALRSELATNPTAHRPKHLVTVAIDTRGELAADLAREIVDLCRPAHRPPGNSEIGTEGVVIAEPTTELFSKLVREGARLIALRDGSKLLGISLYHEPGDLPVALAKHLSAYKRFGLSAFIHLILIDPSLKGGPGHSMLLNSTLLHLQRTGAEIAVGRVESTSVRALQAHYSHGWRQMPSDAVRTISPSGRTATFLGHYLPVSPEMRRLLPPPEIRGSKSTRPDLAAREASELPIGSVVTLNPIESAAEQLRREALSQAALTKHLATAGHRSVVRFTGGCGDMHRRDWLGAVGLFVEAFDGFSGAMIAGATRMQVRYDDGVTDATRGSICDLPLAIRAVNPGAILGGICIGSQTATRLGRHLVVSDGEDPHASFVTVKHPEFTHYVAVDELKVEREKKWDLEASVARDIVAALCEQRFDPVLISFNGGMTTEREVRDWAICGLPVILIRGSGRRTDVLCEDAEFLRQSPTVRVVERNSSSLREALCEFGALRVKIPSLGSL